MDEPRDRVAARVALKSSDPGGHRIGKIAWHGSVPQNQIWLLPLSYCKPRCATTAISEVEEIVRAPYHSGRRSRATSRRTRFRGRGRWSSWTNSTRSLANDRAYEQEPALPAIHVWTPTSVPSASIWHSVGGWNTSHVLDIGKGTISPLSVVSGGGDTEAPLLPACLQPDRIPATGHLHGGRATPPP